MAQLCIGTEVFEVNVKPNQMSEIQSNHFFITIKYSAICFQSELSSTIHFAIMMKSKV